MFWSSASSSWSPRSRGFTFLCCQEPAQDGDRCVVFLVTFFCPLNDLCPLCPTPWLPILKHLRPTNKNLVPKFLRKTETTVFSFILFYGFLAFLQCDHGKTSSSRGQKSRTFLFLLKLHCSQCQLSQTVKEEIKSFCEGLRKNVV